MILHRSPRRAAAAAVRGAMAAGLLAVVFSPGAFLQAQPDRQRPAHRGNAASPALHSGAALLPKAVMLSDIHFEPFQDPALLPELRDSPVERWPALLSRPASRTQALDLEALQKACPVRGVDTSWPLFATSLAQAAAQQPRPLFVTVSGDLLSHAFDCRFKKLAPDATEADLSSFASKTVAFVTARLRAGFPGVPVYLALGNNDSGCTDYREDRNSPFLQQAAAAFAGAVGDPANAGAVLHQFSDQGDYSIALPAPMQAARLIVLQNIFETRTFAACSGKPSPEAAPAQLAWLRTQLADARTHHQHVWVMAHVPPGVDMYSTLRKQVKVCSGEPPAMFLGSEEMADVLEDFPDVISLAVFAHSHEDELRFLHAPGAANGVPVKLIPSISPVNGNRSTFTVAEVDPASATLLDYTVFLTGTGPAATKEYSFRETYKLPAFSAAAVRTLTARFLTDTASTDPGSLAYQHFFFPRDNGTHAIAMQIFWRAYACSLRENSPGAYRSCACPARGSPAQP